MGRYYVGEWLVEPEQNRIVHGSESHKLDPKSVQVLSFLAEHPNEVLTKEQIIDSVWKGAFVSDEVLTTAVWGLRKALGDDAKEPRYIQTIPRQGYRLIAPVERAGSEPSRQWEPSPYPGLSAFSQRDAAYFFGREEEVEALWTKLQERHLLGLIGPSGAGKSSLLRAGLIPARPEGWGVHVSQPRNDPFQPFERFDAWRSEHSEVLVIVDQFEELFTLNDEETQGRFAEFLSGLSKSGVHVLLSMRDDFLIRCHAQPALAPVFERLTPVLALEGAALRKALTEPARASGYRFEDEALVAEILTEVSRERGALPLLAFAASKLWEKRDREERRLTREAYLAIGGVAGSLAKHAEETLSEIGAEREPIVREIFRNLTSGSGTRVPADRQELLTVFEDRATAERVLSKLIDARLLTSGEEEVEIIHESLLTAWPRLVRWQTQDADGAVLRDQLRLAARVWADRGRPDDLLWRGTAYREYRVWRERYSGGLSESEAAFARTMEALATRQRRRQRLAVTATVVSLVAGLTTVGALWRSAEQARVQAEAEARQREAAQLLALGRERLEKDPTQALAYALASLERLDNDPARRFTVEALWRGPTRLGLRMDSHWIRLSADERWLATSSPAGVWLLSREGGPGQKLSATFDGIAFTGDSGKLVIRDDKSVRLIELPAAQESQRFSLEEKASFFWTIVGGDLVDFLASAPPPWPAAPPGPYVLKSWPLDGGEPRIAGQWNGRAPAFDVDPAGRQIAWLEGDKILQSSLASPDAARIVGRHEGAIELWFRQDGRALVSVDPKREIRLWTMSEESEATMRRVRVPGRILSDADGRVPVGVDARGRFLAATARDETEQGLRLWDLAGPPVAEPLTLRNLIPDTYDIALGMWFQRDGKWLATASGEVWLWPLTGKRAYARRWPPEEAGPPVFSPDSRFLVASCEEDALCSWPLTPEAGEGVKVIGRGGPLWFYQFDPTNRTLVTVGEDGLAVWSWPEGVPRFLKVDVSSCGDSSIGSGRFACQADHPDKPGFVILKVWDLESGSEYQLDPNVAGENCAPDGTPPGFVVSIAFLPDGRLLTEGFSGLRLWNVEKGTSEKLRECMRDESFMYHNCLLLVTPDGRYAVSRENLGNPQTRLRLFDFVDRTSREITTHGDQLTGLAMDPSGRTIVTGDRVDGIVRVGPITGEEPHLLYGASASSMWPTFEVSPDGRWVAALGGDRRLRLWPMPEGQPFHTLPYEELLARLRTLTNLRVVPDAAAPSGYRVDIGPFPGWSKLPEW